MYLMSDYLGWALSLKNVDKNVTVELLKKVFS